MNKGSIIGRSVCALWALILGWRLGVLISLAMVGACSLEEPVKRGSGIRLQTPTLMGYVQEVHLKDGTRCAVLLSSGGGGITCQWETELLVK